MPIEYRNIELSRSEKVFVRNALTSQMYGFLLLHVNPFMVNGECVNVLINHNGIVVMRFFDDFQMADRFQAVMSIYFKNVFRKNTQIFADRLLRNKALIGNDGKIKTRVNCIYVFPLLQRYEVENCINSTELNEFVSNHCIFKEDLMGFKDDFEIPFNKTCFKTTIIPVSTNIMMIDEHSINSVLQPIAPEYITARAVLIKEAGAYIGADKDLLVVTKTDKAAKAYMLDDDQINIINKISKGEQLILACAGSGKSVLLIAKCFKAAAMNPNQQFLITCYNKNLQSLYTWFIDLAGFNVKNVTCLTFHALCQKLLVNNKLQLPPNGSGYIDALETSVINALNEGKIANRYYGIFIDEVQEFNTEWYKMCYNLLVNKNSDDHIFIVCGDKTQQIKTLQKHGRAPWNAGDGYPSYRGGNKSIRIEKNYRNCIEINDFINRFVSKSKDYILSIDPNFQFDPDEFLRGQSIRHGIGVELIRVKDKSNDGEAITVMNSLVKIHDENKIPYDEIAIIMYNGKYKAYIGGWRDLYNIENVLEDLLLECNVDFCRLYTKEDDWQKGVYGCPGVKLIKTDSVLGLDFRAVIICGLLPLGEYNKCKKSTNMTNTDPDELTQKIEEIKSDIKKLYVSCTRAKDVLHIILPESADESDYIKLLEQSLS